MLPIQDVLPSRSTPRTTLALIAILAAVLVYELSLSPAGLRRVLLDFGFTPAHATLPTAITSMFIQQGLLAAAANLAALWIFGDNVEDRLGPWRFLALFFTSGLVATAAAVGLEPTSLDILVGPAGAIGGVVGAHVSLFPRLRVLVLVPWWRALDLVEVPSAVIAAFWLLFQEFRLFDVGDAMAPLATTLVMPVAGFACGAVAARLLARPDRMKVDWWS